MTLYLRIDDRKDYDWLRKVIDSWLARNPNDPTLQTNFEFIYAWDQYLKNNLVQLKEIMEAVSEPEALATVLDEKDFKKIEKKIKPPPPQEDPPKRRGRPPSKKSLAAQKKKERLEREKEKLAKQRELAADPFRCPEHPTYGGKNRLSRDCDRCWDIYKKFHPADWKVAYAAFQRNAKKNTA